MDSKVCWDVPLLYLLDISKTLSSWDYLACAVVSEEFYELMERYDIYINFDEYGEGLLIGEYPESILNSYIMLRGAARLLNINVKKAIKQFNFYIEMNGGDITLVLIPNGKCRLEVDINLNKPEIERRELELLSNTIKLMIPNWIRIDKISKKSFPKRRLAFNF